MKKTQITVVMIIMMLTAFLPGCEKKETKSKEKLQIAATVFPLYDAAVQIAGDKADVTMLLPTGAEVHSYEPTLREMALIRECDLFIGVGGSSDAWSKSFLKEAKGKTAYVSAFDCVDLIKNTDGDEDELYDEHVWTSVENMEKITKTIANTLIDKDPKNKNYYQKNCAGYIEKLKSLDASFKQLSEGCRAPLVFADRFPFIYFAEEYGLEYFAAFGGCSEESEPSVAAVSEMIDTVRKMKSKVVFYTETSDQKLADAVCAETGAKKMLLHSCHNVTDEQLKNGISYYDLMNKNYETLKKAFILSNGAFDKVLS